MCRRHNRWLSLLATIRLVHKNLENRTSLECTVPKQEHFQRNCFGVNNYLQDSSGALCSVTWELDNFRTFVLYCLTVNGGIIE